MGTNTTVSGTITLPTDAKGRCAMIAVDDDTTGANGSARRGDGTYLLSYQVVTGSSISFAIDRVPAGTYYLWAYVDTDSSSSDPSGGCEIMGAPSSGDFLGYFDTGIAEPAAPNVTVPHAGGSFDFTLGVYP